MSAIALFEENQVRRAWYHSEEKWHFAIVDGIAILTDSPNPQVFWRIMKKRLKDEGNETVINYNGLKLTDADGKQRMTDLELIFTMLGEASTRGCVPPAAVPMNSKSQTKMNTPRQFSLSAPPSFRCEVPFQSIQFSCYPQTSVISLLPQR